MRTFVLNIKCFFYFYIFKKIIKKYKNYEKYGIILKNPFNKLLYINKYDEIRRGILKKSKIVKVELGD